MKRSTRRFFLNKSTLFTLGVAATTNASFGETEAESALKSADHELARVLRSYGRADAMKPGGFETVRIGNKTRRIPASRVGVKVRDQAAFQASFEELTRLSDRVLVDGNTVRLARGGRFYILENRVA